MFRSENTRKSLMVKVWALLGEGGEKTVDVYVNETRVEMQAIGKRVEEVVV